MESAAQILNAILALDELLTTVIDFSRLETGSHGGSWFSSDLSAREHWENECQRHLQVHEDYRAALNSLAAASYPFPDTWWLPEFVPQVSYLSCPALGKVWMLGTWPRYDARTPAGATPTGMTFYAGDCVEADYEEAMSVEGVMDESVVRQWENVRGDIAETERRLFEGRLIEGRTFGEGTDVDGPVDGFRWRHNGVVIADTMQNGAWRMLRYLWATSDRAASFDDLIEPTYEDADHIAEASAFGSLRRGANKYFTAHSIPWRVTIQAATVSLIPAT